MYCGLNSSWVCFDNPYVQDTKAADRIVHNADATAMGLKMNRESMVLLKNENNLLPLNRSTIKNILVTGPLAAETNYAISRYGPSHNPVTSVLAGIKNYVGSGATVKYAKGCNIIDATWPESEIIEMPLTPAEQASIDSAVAMAKQADVIIAAVGEDVDLVGESLSRTGLNLPGRQLKLIQALQATGKPVVMVMINGQPLTGELGKQIRPRHTGGLVSRPGKRAGNSRNPFLALITPAVNCL